MQAAATVPMDDRHRSDAIRWYRGVMIVLAAFVVLSATAAVGFIVEMFRRRAPVLGLASLASGTCSGTAAAVYGLMASL